MHPIDSDLPVIVKFSASWCAPCRSIAPAFKQLAAKHAATVRCVEMDIDADDAKALMDRLSLSISSVPTFVRIENDVEVGRRVVGTSIADIEALMTTSTSSADTFEPAPFAGWH